MGLIILVCMYSPVKDLLEQPAKLGVCRLHGSNVSMLISFAVVMLEHALYLGNKHWSKNW